MKVIHLLRKPCSEPTVAANVLRWGTGAINVDGCRVEGVPPSVPQPSFSRNMRAGFVASEGRNGEMSHAQGRWPANLTHDGSDEVVGLFPQAGGGFGKRGALNGGATQLGFDGHGQTVGYGDSGSAARFFKHFPTLSTNNTGSNMNTELADYLRTLISPEERTLTTTEGGECVYLHIDDPDSFPWADHADASVHGLTVESSSLAGQAAWLPEALRVLKPGAHLLLAAPDEEPTGHTGACIAEDAGFEVRDCILWVYGEGAGDRLHYTAKAARAEREAGCAALPLRTAAIEEDGDADDMGGESEPPKVSSVRNFHPTVKPVAVMTRLLADVPTDRGPVLEPFMGSGTTLLACIDTGHDAIGIEKDPDYFPIADARVRHRDSANSAWDAVTIVSDRPTEMEAVETTLEALLGL